MKKAIYIIILLIFVSVSANSQSVQYSIFEYDGFIPIVKINNRSASLQSSVLPGMYNHRSADLDMKWVSENDNLISDFWSEQGDTLLHILSELSGLEWYETEFEIYLIRFYPSPGSGNPLIIPIGGLSQNKFIEAPPEGNRIKLNLIYQLSKRMLDQASLPEDSFYDKFTSHPLMKQTPFRRDNLAMLLAMAAAENVMGIDSTTEAYKSGFWRNNFRGRSIFEEYLLNKWILSPEYSLHNWISGEPWNSTLVRATRPPRKPKLDNPLLQKSYVEGLPIKGEFGFSLKLGADNYLAVDEIDQYRLAFACGLRVGDKLRRIDSKRVRHHKNLIEKIFLTFNDGGSTLQIIRDGQRMDIIIQPLLLPSWEDDYSFEDYENEYMENDSLYLNEEDSLYYEDEN